MTDQDLTNFLALLENKGWKVTLKSDDDLVLIEPFVSRYPHIPKDYTLFLRRVESCINRDESIWFLCASDYNETNDLAYRWNAFEIISLEAAEGDEQLISEATDFWDHHFPIVMSVGGDYSYIGLRVSANDFGAVVEGYTPCFEEVSRECDSFGEFVKLFSAVLKREDKDSIFNCYNF